MGGIQLAMAILSFAKELFKYLREQEASNKSCAVKVKEVTDGIKIARKSKDTTKLENSFAALGLGGPTPGSTRVQD